MVQCTYHEIKKNKYELKTKCLRQRSPIDTEKDCVWQHQQKGQFIRYIHPIGFS